MLEGKKTLIVSAVAIIAAVLDYLGVTSLTADLQAEIVLAIMGVIGVVMRFVTKGPVDLSMGGD